MSLMSKNVFVDEHLSAQLTEAAYHLSHHGVVAFPTETVMGLGVVYDDEFAYNRLNYIKHRPEEKPYALMISRPDQIGFFAEINAKAQKLIDAFLPGPLTLLLKVKNGAVPKWVTHGTDTIGIRVPDDPVTEVLLSYTGKPLLAPSANPSGLPPAMNSDEVKKYFPDELDYIVEGHADGGKPSTIVDVTGDEVKIVRQGCITKEMIDNALGENKSLMTVAVGSDHGGFNYKDKIIAELKNNGYEVIDCGTDSDKSVDYPIYGKKVADLVASGKAKFGVVLCGSGEGICIAANKVKGIRCGIGYNDEVSVLLRQHNDANMIAFGGRFMTYEDVIKRVFLFLTTDFLGDRHQRRVEEISEIEK